MAIKLYFYPLALGMTLLPFTASANLAFQAQEVYSVAKTSTGATASVKYAAQTAANQSVYAMRAVQVSKASIANVVRTRSFTPWGAGLVIAITAAGFLLDDSTGEIITTIEPYAGTGYCNATGVTNTFSACYASLLNYPALYTQEGRNYYGSGQNYNFRQYSNSYGHKWNAPQPIPEGSLLEGGDSQATDDQLYDAAAQFDHAEWQKIFMDPLSGQANRSIPEIQDAGTDIGNDYDAENDADPNTSPTVNPATGDTGTDTISGQEPQDQDLCIKNPKLLMCTELEEEVPDSTDIQTQDIPFSYTPYSLASNASCPADINSPAGLISYQPACTFATGIKPMVLVIFSLIGLYILGGFKSND